MNDDAAPSFSIDNVSHNEGNSGTTAYVFTVTKTGATEVSASVDYATANGTATVADNDYQANSGTLTFAANETTKEITVLVNGDTTFETDEIFTVHLSGASNATISTADGTGTIVNDDTQPSFVIDDVTHNEGNSGTTSYVFTVTKVGTTAFDTSVDFQTQDGTATVADNDYQSNTGTLNFTATDATKTITVLVNGDTTNEANEAFTVHLSNASGATISDADGTGTITNDDGAPTFVIDSVTHNEGDTGTTSYVFTVTKTGTTALVSTVDYATVDGTAVAPGDYTALTTATLTFQPSDTTKQVTVVVNGDTTNEADETFTVHLSNPTNATIATADGTGTIVNDDCFEPPANMVAWYAGEGNFNDIQGPTFENGANVGTVNFTTGKVGQAFSFAGGSYVTVPAGSGALNITGNQVTIDGWIKPTVNNTAIYFGKTANASNDYLLLLQFGQLSSIIKAGGVETIVNGYSDFPATTVPYVPAIGQWTHIALTYDGATIKLYANGTLVGSGAKAGNINGDNVPFDIGGRSGGLFFSGLIDEVEAFNRALTGTEISSLFNTGALGKCKHGLIQFSAPTYTIGEAGVNATITVKRTDGSAGAVSARFDTSNNSATAGDDYTAVTNFTVSFADGDTADKTVTIPITDDSVFEGNETVNLALTNATGGAQIGPQGTAVLTITDNDTAPSFAIDNVSHNEGNSGTTSYVFTVTKTGSTALSSSVNFQTQDGTATLADSDYQTSSGTLNFSPTDTAKTITVLVNGDSTFEADEAFTVHLSAPVNATISTADGTGTIVNDDAAPSFSIDNVSHNEGNSGTTAYVFTVTKTGATGAERER